MNAKDLLSRLNVVVCCDDPTMQGKLETALAKKVTEELGGDPVAWRDHANQLLCEYGCDDSIEYGYEYDGSNVYVYDSNTTQRIDWQTMTDAEVIADWKEWSDCTE